MVRFRGIGFSLSVFWFSCVAWVYINLSQLSFSLAFACGGWCSFYLYLVPHAPRGNVYMFSRFGLSLAFASSSWCIFYCWYSALDGVYLMRNQNAVLQFERAMLSQQQEKAKEKRVLFVTLCWRRTHSAVYRNGKACSAHVPELSFNSLHFPLAKGID